MLFMSSHSQITQSENGIELEKLIDKNDTLSLIKHHRKFDSDFSTDWKLNKTEKRVMIDHYKFGYNFEWTKKETDTTYFRTYTFNLNGDFYYAGEERKIKNRLISRGDVNIENNKLKFIRQVYRKRGFSKFTVDYYEFEFYDNGKLVSIYRAEHLNHLYMLTDKKNKNKVQLISGVDYLSIKK